MLRTLRNHTKVIMIIVILFFVASCFAGYGLYVRGGGEGSPQTGSPHRRRAPPKGRPPAERKEESAYALCNPAFPETKSGRRCGL